MKTTVGFIGFRFGGVPKVEGLWLTPRPIPSGPRRPHHNSENARPTSPS